MALLGEDGRGYELARKLEALGIWRSWLGESCYANFAPYLNSPTTWEAFMRADESKSKPQIQLQLRVRALLFDKSMASLSLPPKTPSSLSLSKLNPTYLQLHGDDVYFTLENSSSVDVPSNSTSSMIQSKGAFGGGPRYRESENDNIHQRFRNEVLPETWYNQFLEKYRMTRPYRLSLGDQEPDKRSPDDMSTYLLLAEKNKKRRVAFKEDQYMGYGNSNSVSDGSNPDDESLFLPEIMFTFNCVPDSALPARNRVEEKPKMKFYGVLDNLPRVMTRSAASIERFGINSFLGVEHGANSVHGKSESIVNKKCLSHDQASQLSQKVIARMLMNMGFEGSTEVPIKVFSQLMSCHITELGRILKVLSDSYRKQCSAVELIKMFLQSMKCEFGSLVEHVKDGSRTIVQQSQQPQQQQVHGIETQMTAQAQVALRLQQMPRQLHPQMQQFVQSQNLVYQQQQLHQHQQQQQQLIQQRQPQHLLHQQQLERLQRRQPSSTARTPGMDMAADKDRVPLVQVKIEQQSELPTMDANAFNNFNNRYNQMQFRQQQQQMAAISNFAMSNVHAQPGNQFRPMASLQIPQMQTQNMGGVVRAPPVKVEGFQELMGGDASSKHDSDENRLTSPSSK